MGARGRLITIGVLAIVASAVVALRSVERSHEPAAPAANDRPAAPRPGDPAIAADAGDGPSRTDPPAIAGDVATETASSATLDGDLRIEVIDATGAPVPGVEVAIYAGSTSDYPDCLWTGTTDVRTGIATVRGARVVEFRNEGRARAAVCIASRDAVAVPVDLAHPPRDPIVLAMPATGTVRVAVKDGDRPLADRASVSLHYVLDAGSEVLRWTIPDQSVVDGVATFKGIGTGLRFRAVASCPGGFFGLESEFEGPTAADQVVEHAIDRSHAHGFTGRLLDVDGEPLRNRLPTVEHIRFDAKGPTIQTRAIRTDPEGRFLLWWSDETPAARRRIEFSFSDKVQRQRRAGRDVEPPEPPRMHDLGDVRLVLEPLIVTGSFVDTAGDPVSGSVRLEGRDDDTRSWTTIQVTTCYRPPSRFEMTGTVPFAHLRLRASTHGVESEPVEFALGATGVTLVLPMTGNVAGSVRLTADVDPRTVRLRLLATDASGRARRSETLPAPSGTFEFKGIATGKATLQVLDACGRPTIVIDDIAVAGGETTRDPRLIDIALAGVVTPVALIVVDPSGRAIEGATMLAKAGDGDDRTFRASSSGRIQALAGVAGIDGVVFAAGYRSRTVHLPGDERVVLAPGIQVGIRARPGPPVTNERSTLRVHLRSFEPSRRRPDDLWDDAAFGSDRVAHLVSAEAGVFDLFLTVTTRSERSERIRSIPMSVRITVADTTQPQTFEIELPADVWDESW